MKAHIPTPRAILDAVCHVWKADRHAVLSDSRAMECVIPREVYAYLLSKRGAMEVPQIMEEIGYKKTQVYQSITRVRGWIWADSDFAFRVWESEKLILGITEKYRITNP